MNINISLFKTPSKEELAAIKPVYNNEAQQGDMPSDAEVATYSATLAATMIVVPLLGAIAAMAVLVQ